MQGWMLKSGPRSGDSDKQNNLKRKLTMSFGSFRRKVQSTAEYKRRYFVFVDRELRYFKDASMSKQCGAIQANSIKQVVECQNHKVEHAMEIVTDARTFTVIPESAEEAKAWQACLHPQVCS